MKAETIIDALKRQIADLELQVKRQSYRAQLAEEKCNDYAAAMLNLMSFLSVNGSWAQVSPAESEKRIREGVDMLTRPLIERAEAAEAWRKRAEEQEPSLYIAFSDCGQFIRYWSRDKEHLMATLAVNDFPFVEYYALPKPSPATVPEEWREVLIGLVAIAEKKGKRQGSPNHCHARPGIWDDDNGVLSGKPCAECAVYDKARALLNGASHD